MRLALISSSCVGVQIVRKPGRSVSVCPGEMQSWHELCVAAVAWLGVAHAYYGGQVLEELPGPDFTGQQVEQLPWETGQVVEHRWVQVVPLIPLIVFFA